MKDKSKKGYLAFLLISGAMLLLFAVLMLVIKLVDVENVGPLGSSVGLAALNGAFRDAIGYSELWYKVSELLGLLSFAAAGCFALLGLGQLIKRKSLVAVDADIWLLAALYMAVAAAYVLFEVVVINYRPVIPEGELEASFPSSHTLLAVGLMGSAIYQLLRRVKAGAWRIASVSVSGTVLLLTVVGRMLSGVHWLTDIFGGILLGGGLLFAYIGLCEALGQKK